MAGEPVARKGRERHYCNACALDVTNAVSIKCAECDDIDLCVQCFADGAEFDTHKKTHSYRVRDILNYPLFVADWWADEEVMLLEGIEMHGVGNWHDVGEYMGCKTIEEIDHHYRTVYLDGPTAPLPRTDLPIDPEDAEEYRLKRKERDETDWRVEIPAPKIQKPNTSAPANHEVTGFMSLRGEFDEEHENEAETHVSSLVFLDDDAPDEVELKLKMLDIYNARLASRYERRHFLISRGLVNYSKLKYEEKQRTKDEKEVYNMYKPFARVQSAEDYRLFMEGMLIEHRIRQRIFQLREYRMNGITTEAGAQAFEIDRKKREAELAQRGVRTPLPLSAVPRRIARDKDLDLLPGKSSPSRKSGPLDITGADGFQLLSADEAQLCAAVRILPRVYLSIKESMIREYRQHGILKRKRAREMFRMDVNKTGKLYDFFVSAGWVHPAPSGAAHSASTPPPAAAIVPAPSGASAGGIAVPAS